MIRYFVGHPTVANLVMIGIMALGLSALPALERETFPDIPLNNVQVRVIYPGASAEDVEDAVCRRIEESLDGINDIGEMRCEAREGIATAYVKMGQGGSIDRFLEDVKSEIEAIHDFPDETENPSIQLLGRNDFVVAIAITGPMSEPDLKAYAEDMKDRLQRIPQVTQVNIKGFSDHQIRIELPSQTLRQFGLSVSDIAAVVGRQSVDLPLGSIETTARDILIRFADERRSAADFRDLVVISGESGAVIRLGEIARITDRFEQEETKVSFNGARAALLEVSKARSGDTLEVVDAIKEFLEIERATAPPSMAFDITRDVSTIVRDRLNMVLKNGAQGLFLVALTLWLFFGLRYSFWVAMGLPVSGEFHRVGDIPAAVSARQQMSLRFLVLVLRGVSGQVGGDELGGKVVTVYQCRVRFRLSLFKGPLSDTITRIYEADGAPCYGSVNPLASSSSRNRASTSFSRRCTCQREIIPTIGPIIPIGMSSSNRSLSSS